MNKFLLGTAVSIFLLLSTEVVFADDEEDPAELDNIRVPAPDIPGFRFRIVDGGGGAGAGSGGQDGGGGGQNEPSDKEKYCEQVEFLNELLEGLLTGSATPITGTAASGYSLGQIAAGLVQATIDAAFRDIFWYVQTGDHAPANYTSGIINWYDASIDWDLSGYDDFGAEHVFAAWVLSVGVGNGTSVLTDPDPSTEC